MQKISSISERELKNSNFSLIGNQDEITQTAHSSGENFF